MKYDSAEEADDLIYDVRPEVVDTRDDQPADSKPTEAVAVKAEAGPEAVDYANR